MKNEIEIKVENSFYLNLQDVSHLGIFGFGLFLLLLLEVLLPGLFLVNGQSLELSAQLAGKVQILNDLVILNDGGLLVLVQVAAAAGVLAVDVELALKFIKKDGLKFARKRSLT